MTYPRRRSRGQALAEFALVLPVVMAIVAAIIQFGIVFWAQNTLTQVVRDTGRWEATQYSCSNGDAVVTQANDIAAKSSLMSYYASSPWFAAPAGSPGVNVQFVTKPSTRVGNPVSNCPPQDNTDIDYVQVTITHRVQTFFPGMQFLPQLGSCDANGCFIALTSSAQFRLEPNP
ncbi:MAG TPA: TadE family protein [Candidatus Limnocylindrales bacterium]